MRGIAYLKTAYVSNKQRHLARLKVFAKVLNQDFNDFQFARFNNVLAHGLDSLGRLSPYSWMCCNFVVEPEGRGG